MAVNEEMLKKLESGEMDFSDLSPEDLAAVDAMLENADGVPEGGAEGGADPSSLDPASPAPAAAATPAIPESPAPPEKSKDLEELEAARAQKRDLEALKPATADVKADEGELGEDVIWSKEHQIKMAKDFAALQKKFEAYVESHSKGLSTTEAKLKEREDEADFRILQTEYPEFKSDKKLKDMEADYSKFFYGVGATAENPAPVSRYFSDPAFRAECEAKGFKMDKAEFDKVNGILTLRAKRDMLQKHDPDATLADAHLLQLSRSGKLKARFEQARVNGAAQVAEQIHQNQSGVKSAPPQGGSHNPGDMTEAQMHAWLDAHPNPRTKEEKETFRRIEAQIDRLAQTSG